MNHLTPEEQAALQYVRREFSAHTQWADEDAPRNAKAEYHHHTKATHYRIAADAIEQRAALAAQVVVLRDAAREAKGWMAADVEAAVDNAMDPEGAAECHRVNAILTAALAITLPEAAKQVQEWREKAELLEWLMRHSQSRFDRWMMNYRAANIDGYMSLLDALKDAKEVRDE